MIIAVHKDDPNKWVQLTAAAPLETEVLDTWYIFKMPDIKDLPSAVRVAKLYYAQRKLIGGEEKVCST